MQATIMMINALMFLPSCQQTTRQSGGKLIGRDWKFFPSSIRLDQTRVCGASQLAECCSDCSVGSATLQLPSLKGNCLDGCQHQWPGPHLITPLWPWYWLSRDKREIFNKVFTVFLALTTITTNALLTLSRWYKRQSRWLRTGNNICEAAAP